MRPMAHTKPLVFEGKKGPSSAVREGMLLISQCSGELDPLKARGRTGDQRFEQSKGIKSPYHKMVE